jgi:hypothetical protein
MTGFQSPVINLLYFALLVHPGLDSLRESMEITALPFWTSSWLLCISAHASEIENTKLKTQWILKKIIKHYSFRLYTPRRIGSMSILLMVAALVPPIILSLRGLQERPWMCGKWNDKTSFLPVSCLQLFGKTILSSVSRWENSLRECVMKEMLISWKSVAYQCCHTGIVPCPLDSEFWSQHHSFLAVWTSRNFHREES